MSMAHEAKADSTAGSNARVIDFNITGFGEFDGVKQNPTEMLMGVLPKLLKEQQSALPADVHFSGCTVLEVSGEGATAAFKKLGHSSASHKRVWLHFGVSSRATEVNLENCGWNEATFPCRDQRGWQPQREPILPDEKTCMRTSLNIKGLIEALGKKGHKAVSSDDPGRFLCNWIYFHSLCRSAKEDSISLFIHVPPHSVLSFAKQQEFARDLIIAICEQLRPSSADEDKDGAGSNSTAAATTTANAESASATAAGPGASTSVTLNDGGNVAPAAANA